MATDLRTWLGDQVRGRVVGPDAAQRRVELFESDEPGWFEPGSPIRRVHGDASMFIGGLRALLLQSLHPLAMAGVADHSDYRHDPWGRLQRTADFIAATTFGPASVAERSVAAVRAVHESVTGVAPDGRTYAANDPHLLLWVHVAEIDSFLAAHDRYGADRLVGADRDRYVEETARVAEAFGIPDPPRTERQLGDRLRTFRPELGGTPAARRAARYLLLQPPMPIAVRPAYGVLAAGAVELLPVWTRRHLRLPWVPAVEAAAVRPVGEAITRALRWATAPPPVVPGE